MKKLNKLFFVSISIFLSLSLLFSGCSPKNNTENSNKKEKVSTENKNISKNTSQKNTDKPKTNAVKESVKDKLTIHYINVGQGDAELIQFKGKNLLIDAGPNKSSEQLLTYLRRTGVKRLDFVIATHPHEDHIGNMDDVIREFEIGEFIAPKVSANTKSFEWMLKNLKSKGLKITTAKAGLKLDIHKNLKCEFVAPNKDKYDDLNNYSAVVKLTYGKNRFLFTGDAETLSEKEILAKGFDISADVLKFGHHGSSTSSSKDFLRKVNPKIGIVSCAKGNNYGHPHKETLSKIKEFQIKTYRTDIDGDIILVSDGSNIQKLNKK
ncbi:ComEC/Rec2 family competence protein [Hathewaya histolytica]|uniref:Hydrolase n=1 Tax=Hathewaya histolytica TaxID=1498 RepID=A0A4U9RMN8_HATHI|nr:ComEC/Rec2 family competence protein [Hathewaya histolytica]VTQ93464.1 hydrolase [Hathewaya histolytica]